MRVNLDATLRLVDQENLAKSELLTATLRPHGNGPRKRPIFPGSNDRAYQIISTWVQSLRSPKDMREAARSQSARAQADEAETFAAGRGRVGNGNQEDDLTSISSGGRAPLAGAPMSARIPRPTPFPGGAGTKPAGSTPAAPDDFPLPFAVTGEKPNLAPSGTATGPGAKSSRPGERVAPALPAGAHGPDLGTPTAAAKTGEPSAATKKNAKSVKIDPAILERALQLRNGSH
jgi:hypothetical protein